MLQIYLQQTIYNSLKMKFILQTLFIIILSVHYCVSIECQQRETFVSLFNNNDLGVRHTLYKSTIYKPQCIADRFCMITTVISGMSVSVCVY
jgi:hypothetical protein